MPLTINTIGKRLFLAFSILAANAVLVSALSYHFITRNREIYEWTKRIEDERTQIVRLLKLDLDFLRFETINQEFYRTQESEILVLRDSLYDTILQEAILLQNTSLDQSLGIRGHFDTIHNTLKSYNSTFYQIKEKILYRGFKDFGLEGRMRKFAHELEKHSSEVSMVDVLTLRRHEKDYFLRKEKRYKTQFNELADGLIRKLPADDGFVVHLLRSYKDNFNQLAALDEEIGLLPTQGLMGGLNEQTNHISDQLSTLVHLSDARANIVIRQSLITYIILCVITFLVSFILTYVTATRLTKPIKKLSRTIGKYIVSQRLNEDDLKYPAGTIEINRLSAAFITMTQKLQAQFDEIQRNSGLLEKRNHELQRLNEELDRFIYSSAHDLKSPLASMAGLVHLARREMHVPEHNHYFDKMRSSIEKMEGFIRDITDYAKNKRQQIKPEKIDLHSTLSDIFQSLQFIPYADSIQKSIELSPGEFHTDRTRLEIILKNLVSNAFRYADFQKAQPFIHIEAYFHAKYALIRIQDNGIGIEAHHLHKIFDMFYRANDNAKGSGIGLFLVRESVKMLRGTISVESEPGKGTSFALHLPNLKLVNVNQLPESEPIKFLTAS